MTDLLAGSKIKALDFPPTVHAEDSTSIPNISNTSYAAGSPEVGTTFTAPTSGRVLITVSAGIRNNASNSDRVFVTCQVFLGTSASGTEIQTPTASPFGVSTPGGSATADNQYLSRTGVLEGLTPGTTYYARTMHVLSSAGTPANTGDIAYRGLIVAPTP